MHALVMSVSDVSVSATFMSSWSSTHEQRNRGKAYLGLWFWRAEVHPHREGIGRALCVATGSWREWSHLVDQEVNREEQGPGRYTCCLLWKARFQLLKSPPPSEQQAPPAGESKLKNTSWWKDIQIQTMLYIQTQLKCFWNLFHVCECCTYMCVWTPFVWLVPAEVKKSIRSPGNGSFWAMMWVLEIEPGLSARAAGTLNHWAITAASYIKLLLIKYSHFWIHGVNIIHSWVFTVV